MSKDDEFELILSGNLDQPIPLDNTETLFERIDRIIQQAVTSTNGWIAINSCHELYVVARLSSIALAKFLYEILVNWDKFNIDENPYAVLHERLGIHKYTIQRYTRVWEELHSGKIPEEYVKPIIERGIASTLKVANMLTAGYEPTEDQWKQIAQAPDKMAFQDEIRKVTGEGPSENMINIQMEVDGTIFVYYKGDKFLVGNLDTASGEYAVQKAIYRMTIGGGVSRK